MLTATLRSGADHHRAEAIASTLIRWRRVRSMITIEAEQEHYCLLTDGEYWTVVERRAGKYYHLGDCSHPGIDLGSPQAVMLFHSRTRYTEPVARRILAEVATQWRDLFEHIR